MISFRTNERESARVYVYFEHEQEDPVHLQNEMEVKACQDMVSECRV